MQNRILKEFQDLKQKNKHAFAMLLDPDCITLNQVGSIARKAEMANLDYVFLGGSIMLTSHAEEVIDAFKDEVKDIPVVLFPGSPSQVVNNADALLYLALISGRNPELLIGQHVVSAPQIISSGLEVISTGYMVIDGGRPTTVSYMSHSAPIPNDKPDIALCTAWAAQLQGKHLLYMDAGSGAHTPVSAEMIKKVSNNTTLPLVIGGGIRTPQQAIEACESGAQIVVVGNAIEENQELIAEMAKAIHSL